jgi:SAM-dependent methyltransferase
MRVMQIMSRTLAISGVVAVMALGAVAQDKAPFEPKVGQAGKDVIWVPTPQALVEKMLDVAKLTPKDIHYDLGSGDGRTVIAAAKRGATAFGVEYNPNMVELSRANAKKEGVSDRATFIQGDIFTTDFSKANVITLYLLPSLNLKLRPTILDMQPGTRIVSHSFSMGDWQADQNVEGFDGCQYCRAYFWMVPAKVAGTWKLPDGEIKLDQKYQMLSGSIKSGAGTGTISAGKLMGDEISFTVGSTTYSGKVNGNTMEGVAKNGSVETPFKATRS